MSERNNETWKMVEAELKRLYGKFWRSRGARLFRVAPCALRNYIDNQQTNAEFEAIENTLARAHGAEIGRLEALIAIADLDAEAFETKRREREQHRLDNAPDVTALWDRVARLSGFRRWPICKEDLEVA